MVVRVDEKPVPSDTTLCRCFFSIRNVPGKKLSNSDIKISLRIDEDEVQSALKDKTLLSGILKDTECICK